MKYILFLYYFRLLLLLWHPLLLWLFILSHHQYMSGYHDPVAAGQWSYVPLRLLPSELFDPAGRPCSPPPRDSVTTPPPDRQIQTETINISGAGIKLKQVFTLCVCVFNCTCQWSRLTALKSGVTPRLLPCSTAAP